MDKSMYSLILIDEVVRKIDTLAHTRGISRSSLINHILADHISLLIPQKRIEEIFGSLSRAARVGDRFRVKQQSASMLLLISALNYRYSPAIRYSVEIAPEGGRYICELRVSSRTKSADAILRLNVFFELWSQIEHVMLAEKFGGELRYSMTEGRFRRRLEIENGGEVYPSELLGKSIGAYIRLFDKALGLCFGAEHGVDMQTYEQMSELYRKYMEEREIIL